MHLCYKFCVYIMSDNVISILNEDNLRNVATKTLHKSHHRIKRVKKRSRSKRKRNSYLKRKRLKCSIVIRKLKMNTIQNNKEEVAFWKARVVSLEYENKMLHNHIRRMYLNVIQGKSDHTNIQQQQHQESFEVEEEYCGHEQESESDIEECELKELRKKDENADEIESQPPKEQASKRREREMKLLYGDSWRKMMGMETAIQLNYDLNIEKFNINYWPVVPMQL